VVPEVGVVAVSRPGDVWKMGPHRLICGDARDAAVYQALLGDEHAQMVFTDPPYNVPISGHVCGLGEVRHREFAMAAGEMSKAEFTAFLASVLGQLAAFSADGSIHYVCMDWRHIEEILQAGNAVYSELKNLIVWNKTNGGMGAFYRSKHELVFAFKNGTATHINNFGLGQHGRYRTNVWDYEGISSIGKNRADELAMHPTVKPVAMVADAIRDCSKRGGIVLDAFSGSGTTIMAAEQTGRRGYAIELDPLYVDVAVRRWQLATGQNAMLAGSKSSFADMESMSD
jgi:DNA modification methylase